jgi:hypothetical protein
MMERPIARGDSHLDGNVSFRIDERFDMIRQLRRVVRSSVANRVR